jgi:hypothetical protein
MGLHLVAVFAYNIYSHNEATRTSQAEHSTIQKQWKLQYIEEKNSNTK